MASRLTCANVGPVREGQVGGGGVEGRLELREEILRVFGLHDMCQKYIGWWWVVGQKWQRGVCCGANNGRLHARWCIGWGVVGHYMGRW